MSDDGLISTEAFAQRRGVSARAVRKAIDAGRLDRSLHRSGKLWKINPELADEEWERNTNQRPNRAPSHRAATAKKESIAPAQAKSPTAGQAQAAAIRTMYQAKLLELELRERQNELVLRAALKKRWFDEVRRVRDTFRRFPLLAIGDISRIVGGLSYEQRAELLVMLEGQVVNILQEASKREP